ncbi:alpha/beta hydrolase [Actinomadura rugatobispora]|uniref:Alpha/beta hydrolase n=1 Tax=Actinomadura rugatobispora TaxID=1994 RepID=A0ABW0ZSR3_9ACTN|nr:hypothetical protein GCM10010200_110510 [Actinomadura rugatobispora]
MDVQVLEELLPRGDGSYQRLLIHLPERPRDDVPGVLWLPGVRSAARLPERDGAIVRQLIGAGDCVVVVPDCRAGGSGTCATALRDGHRALLWLRDNARWFGARTDQIAVGGTGRAGALTAALTVHARERGEVGVAFQMPLRPEPAPAVRTSRADDGRRAPRLRLVPPPAEDAALLPPAAGSGGFRGLPPTLTYSGRLDPGLDETRRYAGELRSAGVPVRFEVLPDGGRDADPDLEGRAAGLRLEWFRHAVRAYFG